MTNLAFDEESPKPPSEEQMETLAYLIEKIPSDTLDILLDKDNHDGNLFDWWLENTDTARTLISNLRSIVRNS